MAEGSQVLEERMQDAIRVAAADAMVEELVRVIGETSGDLEVLWQASVFPFPAPEEALAFGKEASDERPNNALVSRVADRLVASSLLALLEDRHILVHRWTAESLKAYVSAEDYRGCCLRAAEYLQKRPVAGRRQWVADLTDFESLRRAFEILTKMKEAKELMPADEPVLDYVKQLIQSQTPGSGA